MPPVGFEHAIPVGERPQTHALDRSATGIGFSLRNTFLYFTKKTVTVTLQQKGYLFEFPSTLCRVNITSSLQHSTDDQIVLRRGVQPYRVCRSGSACGGGGGSSSSSSSSSSSNDDDDDNVTSVNIKTTQNLFFL